MKDPGDALEIKTAEEIGLIRQAAKISSNVLCIVRKNIAPGVSAKKLDSLAYDAIKSFGAEPAFLGYRNYPATICEKGFIPCNLEREVNLLPRYRPGTAVLDPSRKVFVR